MNTEPEKGIKKAAHSLALHGRESMEVKGVTDVVSFDEQSVVLCTVCGNVEVEGSALHIRVFSMETGIVTLDGRIDSIRYFEADRDDPDEKSGFFGKLFR